ncbi:hypothetical protein NPIL_631051, partial [Nephila pilipes]
MVGGGTGMKKASTLIPIVQRGNAVVNRMTCLGNMEWGGGQGCLERDEFLITRGESLIQEEVCQTWWMGGGYRGFK